MIPLNYDSFVNALIDTIPELRPIYGKHISDYDEVIRHLFLGDVTRFSIALFKKEKTSETLLKLLNFLDKAIKSNDPHLQEIISVSFLENLYQLNYNDFKNC